MKTTRILSLISLTVAFCGLAAYAQAATDTSSGDSIILSVNGATQVIPLDQVLGVAEFGILPVPANPEAINHGVLLIEPDGQSWSDFVVLLGADSPLFAAGGLLAGGSAGLYLFSDENPVFSPVLAVDFVAPFVAAGVSFIFAEEVESPLTPGSSLTDITPFINLADPSLEGKTVQLFFTSDIDSVPEPGTLALMALALAGVGATRRKGF